MLNPPLGGGGAKRMASVNQILALFALPLSGLAIDNGRGLTPPMGWRSWNLYGLDVTHNLIMQVMNHVD